MIRLCLKKIIATVCVFAFVLNLSIGLGAVNSPSLSNLGLECVQLSSLFPSAIASGTSCTVSTSCSGPFGQPGGPHDYVQCSSSEGNCERIGGSSVTCDGNIYSC